MNLSAIQSALVAEGLDGWLFFDHHHRDPLAYRVLGLPSNLHVSRRWYYFIPCQGEPSGLVHRIEPHSLAAMPGNIRAYARWQEQAEMVREMLQGSRRIAMQYSPYCDVPYVSMVDAGTLEVIKSCGVEVTTSADLIQLFESVLSEEQIASHLEAGRRMDGLRRAAFEKIGDDLRSGVPVSEFSLKNFLLDQFEVHGLVTDHGPDVAVNKNASDPHYEPTLQRHSVIKQGDVVLIDMWAKLKAAGSIYYDITWVGYCGNVVPDKVQRVYEIVRDAGDSAAGLVQRAAAASSTLRGFQVDDAARSHIEQHGLGEYFFHRTGHSIGVDVHGSGANMDNYETHDERRIIPNTCFSIEPGIYLPEFGIRSEVNILVSDHRAIVTGERQDAVVQIV